VKAAHSPLKGALEEVRAWIKQGYALFLPESRFCLKAITQLLPNDAFVQLLVPRHDGSYAPLFLVHRMTLLDGRVSHPEDVRLVLGQEIPGNENRALPAVRLMSFTATDERVAEVVEDLLGVRIRKE